MVVDGDMETLLGVECCPLGNPLRRLIKHEGADNTAVGAPLSRHLIFYPGRSLLCVPEGIPVHVDVGFLDGRYVSSVSETQLDTLCIQCVSGTS